MKKINGKKCPYIIAEAGVNHNGRLATALELVKAAHGAGADCIKFQAFTAEELVVKNAEKAQYQKRSGPKGESQYDMLKRLELKESEFAAIKKYCDELEIDFLVTPFSPRWVRIFYEMGVTAFKIGSGNLNDRALLEAIGQTHLPVIISTGMSDLTEIDAALATLRKSGSVHLAVLHCISLYPTQLKQVDVNAIKSLAEHTHLPTGFSDHTEELTTGAVAVAAGAVILEKHFTLDKNLQGPDHKMSLDPEGLKKYVGLSKTTTTKSLKNNIASNTQNTYFSDKTIDLRKLYKIASGNGKIKPLKEELEMKKLVRLSLVSTTSIPPNTEITPEMITVKRPGTGIPANKIHEIIGNLSARAIPPDHILEPEDIKPQSTGF